MLTRKRFSLINRRGKGVIFHRDNACLLAALLTKDLEKFGCEIFLHPAYSPNLASLDYHLF